MEIVCQPFIYSKTYNYLNNIVVIPAHLFHDLFDNESPKLCILAGPGSGSAAVASFASQGLVACHSFAHCKQLSRHKCFMLVSVKISVRLQFMQV